MEQNILISVIVPVYKVEKYLSRCIKSILEQTFVNFELLLIDDGSPDFCGQICEDWARKDVRISVIHQKNAGLSAARNTGIDNAKGKYIVFIDSDDYVSSNYLLHFITALPVNENKAGLGFVIQGYNKCMENGDITKTVSFVPHIYSSADILTLFSERTILDMGSAWAKMYELDFLNKNNIRFNTTFRFAEDVLFMFECMKDCDYVSVGSAADYNYINYIGTMSKIVTPFCSEYNTLSSCRDMGLQLAQTRNMSSEAYDCVLECLHLFVCRALKADYHYMGSVEGTIRRSNLHILINDNYQYMSEYYHPDYLVDKIGRWLLKHKLVWGYDVLFVILFKLKFRKMFCPPSVF